MSVNAPQPTSSNQNVRYARLHGRGLFRPQFPITMETSS